MNRNGVAEGLRHLLAFDDQVFYVDPVEHERFAGHPLGLGDLVLMMRKNQVFATHVDVQRLSELSDAHDRALEVPAGPPSPPRRIPGRTHRLVHGFGRLPEGEVTDIFLLVLVVRHTGTRARAFGVQPLEATVGGERADRKKDRSVLHGIGEPLLFEPLDPRHHLGDVPGGQWIDPSRKNPEGSRVGQDVLGERSGVLAYVLLCLGRSIDGLVVHVGEVHDEVDLVAGPRQITVE